MKKRRLQYSALLISISLLAASIGYICGAARIIEVETKASVGLYSAVLGFMSEDKQTRATSSIENILSGYLNTFESLENHKLFFTANYILQSTEPVKDWESVYERAKEQVKEIRSEQQYLAEHPEEVKARFERAFAEAFQKTGNTNIQVELIGSNKDSLKVKIKGVGEKIEAQQSSPPYD